MRRLLVCTALALTLGQPAYAACTAAAFDPQGSAWAAWGRDGANSRYVNAADHPLTARELPRLALAWAFGFAGAHSAMGQPTVTGNRVFIGVDTGDVYALDAASGCAAWRFKADASVRTAPAIAEVRGRWTVFFGDLKAQVYAVDAATGALEWKVKVDAHPAARITGSPQFLRASAIGDKAGGNESGGGAAGDDHRAAGPRLFVPVSSGEEGAAGNPRYPCCSFRGSVVALDAATGARIWKTYTIARPVAATGKHRFGPSGAAVWAAPAIDARRGLLYAVTGDAYSAPAAAGTDAVMAMDIATGAVRWVKQATAGDIWTVSCLRGNAPASCGPDQDFGAPPMLVTAAGRSLLIAGQKSGNVWAFDPATGARVWRTPLVADTTKFGGKIVWGGAADASKAYFGLGSGGVAAVRLADGVRQWFTPLAPAPAAASHPGQDSPLTVSAGVVFSGGWDGVLRALAAASGKVLWQYDTARPFRTVNAVAAHGGSIGAAGPVVAGGRLLVPSGYVGVKNGMPGNVLLAFAVRQ